MSTDKGCAPGMCQGRPAADFAQCAEVNGCDVQPGYDDYSESRAVVRKVQADMRAEILRDVDLFLDTPSREDLRARAYEQLRDQREQATALDYAETRLSEMRAQLEALADEFSKPFGPDASKWPAGFTAPYAAVAEAIREVARG